MSESIQAVQTDFIADLMAANPNVGRMAWFTVNNEPINQTQWIQALANAGLLQYGTPQGIPAGSAYLRGLHAMQAMAKHSGHGTLLRRVERKRGSVTHHWIEETLVQGRMQFTTVAAITRDTAHDVLSVHRMGTMANSLDEVLGQLPELIKTAQATYTPGDRRRQILRWFQQVGALHLANAGPVQFLPESAAALIDNLVAAQTDLGLQVWSMPLSRSADVIDTLTQSLDVEINRKTATLLKKIHDLKARGEDPTPGQQAKVVEQLHDLNQRVKLYSDLFGDQLTALTTQIEMARSATRSLFVA